MAVVAPVVSTLAVIDGIYTLEAPGGRTWRFKLTMNELIKICDRIGQERFWALTRGAATLGEVRGGLHIFATCATETEIALEDVGLLMTALGPKRTGDLWKAALQTAFGANEEEEPDADGADPKGESLTPGTSSAS